MFSDVTVCIASIPIRPRQLRAALASVCMQTLLPRAIIVEIDHDRAGAAATKNRALARSTTEWTAFLDDDDVFYPDHLSVLRDAAEETGADVTYSKPYVTNQPGGEDPSGRHGLPFDAAELRRRSYIQTSSLVRTELAQKVGGFQVAPGTNYDDWGFFLALLDGGASFYHVPMQTFEWRVSRPSSPGNAGNTSGRGDRW